jgi:hypothetical protein
VFHSLLGYADQPTVLQAAVWVAFVAVTLTCFIAMGRRARAAATPRDADLAEPPTGEEADHRPTHRDRRDLSPPAAPANSVPVGSPDGGRTDNEVSP